MEGEREGRWERGKKRGREKGAGWEEVRSGKDEGREGEGKGTYVP